jgi:hypothetical protein
MLALLLSLATAAPAAAVPATPPPVVTPSVDLGSLKSGPYRADAMAFAEATMPEKPFQDMMTAMMDKGFDEGLGEGAAELEKASPGIVAEFREAVKSATAAIRAHAYRDTLERYARLYSQSFTPAETAELAQFYRTATGQKLIAAKYASLATGDIPFDRATTTQDVSQINKKAVGSVMDHMGGDDMIELMKFGTMPAFRKLNSLTPIVNQLEAEMANEENPEAEEAVASAIASVMQRRGLVD